VHPRAILALDGTVMGASPRARGNPVIELPDVLEAGCIPARAGEPDLGDARSFSLDSPKSRAPKIDALRRAASG
jgi:hypothetical protein